jgi:SNF2 family DNA or RNA helicase
MTPTEIVLQKYTLPFTLHPLQVEVINLQADLRNAGLWLEMSTGKTVVSTVIALYQNLVWGTRCVVIMPPVLVTQWGKWLSRIGPKPLTVTSYRGTPKHRETLDLGVQFVLVGVQVFKRDFPRFMAAYGFDPRTVIIDEATIVGNIDSANHEQVYDFALGSPVMALSGTPLNKPGDAYGLMKFTAPGTYRSKKQFENLHVKDRDFYGSPTAWQNLDQLAVALNTNSSRVLFRDMYAGMDKPVYVPLEYDLDPEHERLYRRLVNEEMLKLPDGGKIDGSTSARLRHALGQIVVNWAHFAGTPKRSEAVKLIEEKLAELGSGKLVVFANYKMTVAHLTAELKEYGAISYNSEVSAAQKDKNFDRFCSDPKCRVIIVQFISGGKGLDGFQHVCHTCLFIEPCLQPRDFHQAVARLDRTGQTQTVQVILAIADRTLQIQGFRTLIENDTLVNKVVRNAIDLKNELLGL